MFRFAIKVAAVVFTIVFLFLSGYYLYITRFSSDFSNITDDEVVQNDSELQFGTEVSEDINQIFGTYDMFDGNRLYVSITATEKYWVFLKPKFNLYCTDSSFNENSQFEGKSEEKQTYEIGELFQRGDNMLVSFIDEGGEKYLDKIMSDSPTACGKL